MDSKLMSAEERIIHLDLKGAPPKISYYEWLFPLLHKWGATGLLIEYEDMFPYSGELHDLAAPNAYTHSELERLQLLANQNQLMIIPLVQTFGHFEFVLKHDKFRHLRELEQCPMTLCPLHEEALPLVAMMIDQVIHAHGNISWFHVGADEVFHLGLCSKCQAEMSEKRMTPFDLFMFHIRRVLEHLRSKYRDLHLIMWDDMFRGVDLQTLQDSGLGDLVEPMVWHYQAMFSLPQDIWHHYTTVFKGLWVASAFKGATGPCMTTTDIGFHVENHKEWLNIVMATIRPLSTNFRGYALTGWQRYDHYSVLCELLPVGLPSLAICLLTVKTGAFTMEVHRIASHDLDFKELIPMNALNCTDAGSQCRFLGSDVFQGVHRLVQLKAEYKFFMKNDRLRGWMTSWHVRNNYTNPAHVNHFLPNAQQLLEKLKAIRDVLETALSEVFYPDAVDEWMAVNVHPMVNKFESLVGTAVAQIALGGRVKNLRAVDPMET